MKCEQCSETIGKDVEMESLGGGQHQCPDCRHVAATATVAVEAAATPPSEILKLKEPRVHKNIRAGADAPAPDAPRDND
jgi:hypothetical protein